MGGGIAGCAAAVGLHQRGHDVLLVERQLQPTDSFAGEYLQPFALRALEALGFAPSLENRNGARSLSMRFREVTPTPAGDRFAIRIDYPDGDAALGMPRLDLIAAVREHARAVLGERFVCGARILEQAPGSARRGAWFLRTECGSKQRIQARWTFACDGRTSRIRNATGGPGLKATATPAWEPNPSCWSEESPFRSEPPSAGRT